MQALTKNKVECIPKLDRCFMMRLAVGHRHICKSSLILRYCSNKMDTSPSIVVSPNPSMSDEKLSITIQGLKPSQPVTLYATAQITNKCLYESFAHYVSSGIGSIHLSKDASKSGSYSGIEPMGLFWSMKPYSANKRNITRFIKKDITTPLNYNISVFENKVETLEELRQHRIDGNHIANISVYKMFMATGVKRFDVRCNGIVGTLFLPPGDSPFPGLINMFGGYPGVLEFKSALHASHGFASLALAYIGAEQLPSKFTDVLDLGYFENAVQFMKNHELVNGKVGIGLVGICKGAQIAMAMATHLTDIRCVVCINGTVCASCGNFQYRDLFIPESKVYFEHLDPNKDNNLVECCVLPLPGGTQYLPGFFPCHQRKNVAYMIISGESDACSPSSFMADEFEKYFSESSHPDYEIVRYSEAGHLIEPPYAPFCEKYYQPGDPFNAMLKCGGEMVAHCRAQEDSWCKQLQFLKERLIASAKL